MKSQDGCGRKGSGSIRIVGGTQIRRHEYPWMCSLRRRGGHICGITLLSVYPRKTILVGAAHCYSKTSKAVLYVLRLFKVTVVIYIHSLYETCQRNFYLNSSLFILGPTNYYTIVCGEHELNSNEKHQVELKVTKVITHPKWVTASQGYDIAIYQVSKFSIQTHVTKMPKNLGYQI